MMTSKGEFMTSNDEAQKWENPLSDSAFAGETEQGVNEVTALPARLDRYHVARSRSLCMADYSSKMGDAKTAASMHRCGAWLVFRQYYTVGKVRLHAATFCKKHLLCPLCAIRRAAKHVKLYHTRVKAAMASSPALRPYFVTLTVKDGADLPQRFRHIQNAFSKLQQQRRSYLRGKGPHVEMAKAQGIVGSYEVKRGKNSGLWHPHIHMVWLCATPPDPRKISKEWLHLTGDSFIVDARPLEGEGVEGFLEVFKYALKMGDMPLADNWEAAQFLARKRLVFSIGDLFGVEAPDDLTDDEIALDDLPYIELVYRHTRSGYQLDVSQSRLDPNEPEPDPLEGLDFDAEKRAQFEAWNRQRLADAEADQQALLLREAMDEVNRLRETDARIRQALLMRRATMSPNERFDDDRLAQLDD